MKVRVVYSMELDEVPDKINEMLRKQCNLLSDCTKNLSLSSEMLNDKQNADICSRMLEQVRSKMLDIDTALGEMTGILQGYTAAIQESDKISEGDVVQAPPVAVEKGES